MAKPLPCLLSVAITLGAPAAQAVEVGYCSPLKDLEAVKAAGFDYAELRTSEVAALSDAEFESLALRLQRLALPVPATYLFVPREVRLTGPDVDEAAQMAYVRKALDRVARLGARSVVLGSGPARNFPDGFPKAEAYRQFVGFCKRAGSEARARGITIAIEPQRKQESNLINNVTEGLELVRAVNDPNVQLTVDFYHVAEEKEDPAVVITAKDHVRHVHMANPVKRVFPQRWDEYGYAPFFATLRKIGYAGRISIEASAGDFAREAPIAIALLKRALTRDPEATSFRFDLRPGAAAATAAYSDERGYGFDFGTAPGTGRSFFFSVAVPEGNYRVSVKLGDAQAAATTTVRAESRRLMLENVATAAGALEARTFAVNVRNRWLPGGDSVRLKGREQDTLHWDDKLTLEFAGVRPAVAMIEIGKAQDAVTVFLAGDSTVTDQTREPWAAWGQMLPRFFTPSVAIANHAESGETLKAFFNEGRFEKILCQLKAGDFLFFQFNHNDQKPGANYSAPFGAYQEQLRVLIAETRKRGATPVLVTSMLRRSFDASGRVVNTLGEYPEALRQLAKEQNVPLIDLNVASRTLYETLGPEASKRAFVHYPAGAWPGQARELKDDTHFNPYGAYQVGKVVVEGIRTSVPGLAKHLAPGLAPYDPAHPDPVESWDWPPSPPLPEMPATADGFFPAKDMMTVGVYYYPEAWPREQWARDLANIKKHGFEFVHIGEFAWAFMEPEEGRYDFEWLETNVRLAAEQGLRVVLCTPSATPPAWLSRKHPEILMVDARGRRMNHGSREQATWSSPVYRQHVERIDGELARRFGANQTVVGWQIDNELSHYGKNYSYAPADRDRFRLWLRSRYGDIRRLNEAWGNAFWSQMYNDFDQIDIPNPEELVAAVNEHALLDFQRFFAEEAADFIRFQALTLRRFTKNQWVTSNFMHLHKEVYPPLNSDDLDIITWTLYPAHGNLNEGPLGFRLGDGTAISFMGDFARTINGKSGLMELQPGQVNWGDVNPQPYPGAVRNWILRAFAMGSQLLCTYRYREPLFGNEQMHAGIVGTDGVTLSRGGEEWAQAMRELRVLRENRPTEPKEPARYAARRSAMLYNVDNRFDLDNHPQTSRWDTMGHIFKYERALKSAGAPVDVITEDKDFTRYPFLIAPALQLVDAALVARLRTYAEGGGNLILSVRTGLKDRSGHLWEGPWAAPILDLVGSDIRLYDVLPLPHNGRVKSAATLKSYDWGVWAEILKPRAGTTVLARHEDQFYAGEPTVVTRKLGNGTVTYVGVETLSGDLEKEIVRKLFTDAAVAIENYPDQLFVDWRDGFWIASNFSSMKQAAPIPPGVTPLVGTRELPPAGVAIWRE